MDLGTLFLFIALLVALAIIAFQQFLHYREKEDIFKKFMARDLHEAEYFSKIYPKEMEEKRKAAEEERKHPPSESDLKRKFQADKM